MAEKNVRQVEMSTAEVDAADKITVKNLEVIANAGVDAWGRQKKQRVLLTVTLALKNQFDTAAKADSLDTSTIHYGVLSKDIQAAVQAQQEWMSTKQFSSLIQGQVLSTAHPTQLIACEIDTFYPKGSMFGDGAGCTYSVTSYNNSASYSEVLYLRNLRIACIIGVNPNERLQKQPVVVNIRVECLAEGRSDDYQSLEKAVFEAISDTSFETLESLTTTVVQELREKFFTEQDAGSYIRLRIEKPLAVPFADAPAIEIFRPVKA
ncbi:hypothetical protein P280DRAFT_176138 [Massarina eburnea CBS 473.64]|uniref:dihydroneopterin aldolase n=1 Tax=Massarina eburnea CBS 473.64 TaxID=1395130 RepID=A0A6A6SBR5_9PLEO|nr:hypothetical protein P280DRAFT_176138 [Massarina eburnea CBS 473.64]